MRLPRSRIRSNTKASSRPTRCGGTDLNRPRDERLYYNQVNRHAEFDEMDVIDMFEFTPNQAVMFVKTFNSWQSVRPMTGMDPSVLCKTLTINIVKKYWI
jgi:hypothetical protein